MRGSQRTGKFTELAMKQAWWAVSWAASALPGSLAALIATVTRSLPGWRGMLVLAKSDLPAGVLNGRVRGQQVVLEGFFRGGEGDRKSTRLNSSH